MRLLKGDGSDIIVWAESLGDGSGFQTRVLLHWASPIVSMLKMSFVSFMIAEYLLAQRSLAEGGKCSHAAATDPRGY